MTTRASGTFEVSSFDEETTEEFGGGLKLTRARIVQKMTGGLDGEMTINYLMQYRDDATACFVGFQRFVGRMGDRTGSFVMEATGGYDGTSARTTSFVVSGSGSGDLDRISGAGTTAAPHGSTGTYTFDFDA